ncbi:MAG TPA: ABC transporter permease [Candidatus Methylacidiphilales bacterium]|nr:ABC transporter permease [Candidatus Methylacidiphilales bacterium]
MNRLALRMLFGDQPKYIMLVCGLTFASLLMTQQTSVFCGLMIWTTSTVRNVRAKIWVVDPKVEQANEVRPLRDTDVNRVRTVPGVAWALPLFSAIVQAKLIDGTFQNVMLMGLDSATLAGRPARMLRGSIEDLRLPNTVVIDVYGIEKLSRGHPKPIDIGDVFEINDKEARIVGICIAERSFTGAPYVYTTYEKALNYAPKQRKMLSFVIAEPVPGADTAEVARRIASDTGLRTYTEDEFFWSTIWWYVYNTGIPVSFGTTIALGFIVGVAVSGQTFYTFILENLRHLGALKAMGASNWTLIQMVVLQAFTVGLLGYGIGVGLAAFFGYMVLDKGQPPFYMPPQLLIFTFVVTVLICSISALLGIRKVVMLDAAIVFRG